MMPAGFGVASAEVLPGTETAAAAAAGSVPTSEPPLATAEASVEGGALPAGGLPAGVAGVQPAAGYAEITVHILSRRG